MGKITQHILKASQVVLANLKLRSSTLNASRIQFSPFSYTAKGGTCRKTLPQSASQMTSQIYHKYKVLELLELHNNMALEEENKYPQLNLKRGLIHSS